MTKFSQVSWKSYSSEVQAFMMLSLSKVLFEPRPLAWIILFFIYNVIFVPEKKCIFFYFQKLYCKFSFASLLQYGASTLLPMTVIL